MVSKKEKLFNLVSDSKLSKSYESYVNLRCATDLTKSFNHSKIFFLLLLI